MRNVVRAIRDKVRRKPEPVCALCAAGRFNECEEARRIMEMG